MYKCEQCNIYVYDEAEACPLCHRVLNDLTEEEEKHVRSTFGNGAPYPEVRKKEKLKQFMLRLVLFLFLVSEIVMVTINYFYGKSSYMDVKMWWSGICGVAMIYIYFSLVYWINHDSGVAAKIGLQLILTFGLLFGIDWYTGMNGWSLQWAIPGVILFGDAIVFFLMMLQRYQWYSYSLLLFFLMLCCIGIIALYAYGVIHYVTLPIVSISVTGFYLLATIVFGDRQITRELKRRFRV